MQRRIIITVFLVLLLIALSSCTKRECKETADCADKKAPACKQYTCAPSGTCLLRDKPGCCLDSAGKECKGKVGEFIEKYCDEEAVCRERIIGGQQDYLTTEPVSIPTKTNELGRFSVTYNYKIPFDYTKDKVKVFLKPEIIKNDIKDLKIDKLRVIRRYGKPVPGGKWSDSRMEILAERTNGQIFWDTDMSTDDEFVLTGNIDKTGSDPMTLTLYLLFSYQTKRNNVWVPSTTEIELPITKNPLTAIWPSVPDLACPACPKSTNPCIQYMCHNAPDSKTNFQCIQVYGKDCVTNRICEPGENRCKAPSDCGKPDVDVGVYLVGYCRNDLWLTKFKKSPEKITITKDMSGGGGVFDWTAYVEYENPLKVKDGTIKLKFSKKSTSPALKQGPKIKKIQVKEGNTLYGEKEVNLDVGARDQEVEITLDKLKEKYEDHEEGRITNLNILAIYEVVKQDSSGNDRSYTFDTGTSIQIPMLDVANPTG